MYDHQKLFKFKKDTKDDRKMEMFKTNVNKYFTECCILDAGKDMEMIRGESTVLEISQLKVYIKRILQKRQKDEDNKKIAEALNAKEAQEAQKAG